MEIVIRTMHKGYKVEEESIILVDRVMGKVKLWEKF